MKDDWKDFRRRILAGESLPGNAADTDLIYNPFPHVSPRRATGVVYHPSHQKTLARDCRRIRMNWPTAQKVQRLVGSCPTCGHHDHLYTFFRPELHGRYRTRLYCAVCGTLHLPRSTSSSGSSSSRKDGNHET